MGLFGLLNYEDYILNTIVKSNYARNGLIIVWIYIVTGLLRFHLSILICFLIRWNLMFDLIFPIIVTVLLSLASDTLFKYVETHRSWNKLVVDYFIKNYSRENFVRWKRILLLILCCYVVLAVMFITIDNRFILITTFQTAISFGICDLLEQKMPQTWYNYLMSWWHHPRITKFSTDHRLIDNYIAANFYQLIPTDIEPKQQNSLGNHKRRYTKIKNTLRRSLDSILPQETKHFQTINSLIAPIPRKPLSPLKITSELLNIYDELERVSPVPRKPSTPPTLIHNSNIIIPNTICDSTLERKPPTPPILMYNNDTIDITLERNPSTPPTLTYNNNIIDNTFKRKPSTPPILMCDDDTKLEKE